MKTILTVVVLAALVSGCAPNTIKGTDKAYDVVININNNQGYVHLESPLKVDSASETTQDANPSTVISPETALAMPSGGSTASIAAQAASQSLKDIASKLTNDLSKKNSENPTTTTTTTPAAPVVPVVKPATPATPDDEKVSNETVEPSEDIEYKQKSTYSSYGKRNGDRYAWRISKKGIAFGQPIKIVFNPSGKSFVVADTSKNCRDRQDTCNRDSKAEMYGFVFKPGIGPNGEGDSDTGTSHGGVYLQGPYGLSDQSVTIYYNEP